MRSSRKGPHVNPKLLKKVTTPGQTGPITAYDRSSQIPPEFVGHNFAIHNGHKFINVYITEDMVGHRLGEFAPTRTFKGHGRIVKRVIEKT